MSRTRYSFRWKRAAVVMAVGKTRLTWRAPRQWASMLQVVCQLLPRASPPFRIGATRAICGPWCHSFLNRVMILTVFVLDRRCSYNYASAGVDLIHDDNHHHHSSDTHQVSADNHTGLYVVRHEMIRFCVLDGAFLSPRLSQRKIGRIDPPRAHTHTHTHTHRHSPAFSITRCSSTFKQAFQE